MNKSLLSTGQLGWATLTASLVLTLTGGSCSYAGTHDPNPNIGSYFNEHGGPASVWVGVSLLFSLILAEAALRLNLFRPATHNKFELPAIVASVLATFLALTSWTVDPSAQLPNLINIFQFGLSFIALLVCSPKPTPEAEP